MINQADRRSFLKAMAGSALAAGAARMEAQPENPIRLAMIGTGHRAWAHLGVLKTLPQFQVVALADPTAENLARAAELAPGAKTYSDYHQLLSVADDADAAVVITPNFLHAEATVAALERGLPVLCEKPIATNVEDANRMIEASRKAGKMLYIGFQLRLDPTIVKMRELYRAGTIGKLEFVSTGLLRGDWNPASWKYTDPKTGAKTNWRFLTFTEGGALLEDGIHQLDFLNWMIDSKVLKVMATGGNNVLKQRETIDHAAVIVEYENDVKLSFDFMLFANNSGDDSLRVVLVGDQGILKREHDSKVSIRSRSGSSVRYIEVKDNAPKEATAHAVGVSQDPETYQQYVEFARALTQGAPPLITGEQGKVAMKISLLAEASVRQQRIMSWDDLPA